MSYRGTEVGPNYDFSGGQCSAKPKDSLELNEATECKNLIILPGGRGIRSRLGDTAFNGTAMNSGANVQGLIYYKQQDADEWLVAVAGAKIFKSEMDGTMDDITDVIVVTAGVANTFTPFVAEDEVIFVGGAPDAPFKWTGSGNAVALGGSPPTGRFGFYHNNRAFIGSPTGNRSRIYWSILNDIEDWSGTGSGNADVHTNDGDVLVGAAVLNEYMVLLFKENSIHKMIGRVSPFPVTLFVNGIGAAGKHAIVNGPDGLVYFITPKGRMAVTDGNRILNEVDLPRIKYMDDIWNTVVVSRLDNIFGISYVGKDFRHIIWSVTLGTTNDTAIIWDVDNKCWIYFPEGYSCNVMAKEQDGTLYGGHTDGKIYQKDVASTYTDASESSANIKAIWRSGWNSMGGYMTIKNLDWMSISIQTQSSSGNLSVKFGVDFNQDLITKLVDIEAPGAKFNQAIFDLDVFGGQDDVLRTVIDVGLRGNVFQYAFDNTNQAQVYQVNGYSLSGKLSGQKEVMTT